MAAFKPFPGREPHLSQLWLWCFFSVVFFSVIFLKCFISMDWRRLRPFLSHRPWLAVVSSYYRALCIFFFYLDKKFLIELLASTILGYLSLLLQLVISRDKRESKSAAHENSYQLYIFILPIPLIRPSNELHLNGYHISAFKKATSTSKGKSNRQRKTTKFFRETVDSM